jgi:hypothetical protein
MIKRPSARRRRSARQIRSASAPAVVFAADLAADRLPSVRAIRAALHVGQPRAQQLRGDRAAAAETHGENLAA